MEEEDIKMILPIQLQELKLYNNWVVYRNFKHGKLPFNPITHLAVKTNDPSTWSDYNSALLCYQNHSYDGIGFVFNNNQYIGIDLDNCISNNIIDPFALEIVNLINSYTEYSPSNKGLHILCKSKLLYNIGIKRDNIEIYSYNRFFTISGNIYLNRMIEFRDRELQILLQKINDIPTQYRL